MQKSLLPKQCPRIKSYWGPTSSYDVLLKSSCSSTQNIYYIKYGYYRGNTIILSTLVGYFVHYLKMQQVIPVSPTVPRHQIPAISNWYWQLAKKIFSAAAHCFDNDFPKGNSYIHEFKVKLYQMISVTCKWVQWGYSLKAKRTRPHPNPVSHDALNDQGLLHWQMAFRIKHENSPKVMKRKWRCEQFSP